MSLFYSFENRLILQGRLMTTTALRIGAGRSLEPTGTDLPVLRDALDRPFVPGSSFKGVLRSRIEAVLRSLAPDGQEDRWACNPLDDDKRCVRRGEIRTDQHKKWEDYTRADPVGIGDLQARAEALEKDAREAARQQRKRDYPGKDHFLAELVDEHSCLACRLFGSPWLASHVQVRDWLVDETFWLGQFQERDGVAIDRDTETASEKKLYSYEVVPTGTVFEGVIITENAESWQLGLLMAGLNEFEHGSLALGGATSRGLGGVTLAWQWPESRFIESRNLLDYLEDPQAGQSPEGLRDEWKSAMLTKLRSMRNGSAEKGGA